MQIANPRVIGIAALVVAVVGLVVNLQSVSVLTGDSITYVGLVVAVLAGVAAFVVKRVRLWMRIVVAIIVALCIVNTITVQVQLNHRQDQLSQIGAIGSALN